MSYEHAVSGRGAPGRFGAVLTAMATPFDDDGRLDLDGAATLARWLTEHGNDGLVVSGTTGEAPVLSDEELVDLWRAVCEAVTVPVVAGSCNNDTAHSIRLTRQATEAGAAGIRAVTPYYSRPPQAGLLVHFRAIADATGLPVMLYDIPIRSGTEIETETLVRLAEHDRIVAVKDAKGAFAASAEVIARTDLAFYSGDDVSTLPLLALGAVGLVSVVGHVLGEQIAAMIADFDAGRVAAARAAHLRLLPAFTGFFRTQGLILTKAALRRQGLPAGPVRPPLVDATPEQVEQLRRDCAAAGLELS